MPGDLSQIKRGNSISADDTGSFVVEDFPPTGRTLYSRAGLRKVHDISESTLQNLWTDREDNGHPPVAVTFGGVMHWDDDSWAKWHHELQRRRAAASTTNPPKLDGDPGELVGPAEAAKICGFADSATVSHYVENPRRAGRTPTTGTSSRPVGGRSGSGGGSGSTSRTAKVAGGQPKGRRSLPGGRAACSRPAGARGER